MSDAELPDEHIVAAIGEREAALAGLADGELTRKAVALRERVRAGEHLDALQQVRDEIHLVQLDGRQPVVEFCRLAIRAFEDLLEHSTTRSSAPSRPSRSPRTAWTGRKRGCWGRLPPGRTW